jgi:hypothetical protein
MDMRAYYEERFGRVSDRQWLRVRTLLELDLCEKIEQSIRVGHYCEIKMFASRGITLERVLVYRDMKGTILGQSEHDDLKMSGNEIQRVAETLAIAPSQKTLYNWGREMMLPFRANRVYTGGEAIRWLYRLAMFSDRAAA